jgi:hypothetical protein
MNPQTNRPPQPIPSKDSYVKLAMRNMVKKGKTSLLHFSLTVIGLLSFLIVLAVFFH